LSVFNKISHVVISMGSKVGIGQCRGCRLLSPVCRHSTVAKAKPKSSNPAGQQRGAKGQEVWLMWLR